MMLNNSKNSWMRKNEMTTSLIKGDGTRVHSSLRPSLVCPGCAQLGTFEKSITEITNISPHSLSIHRCPNDKCKTVVYCIHTNGKLSDVYPPIRIDFDKTYIPANLVSSFEEAITCFANKCFVASAILVRKTLEQLCHERGANGPNLLERIKALRSKITVPEDLFEGLDDLRLLGNDAAHVESRTYETVGSEEIEVAIIFTKEILKATYQYKALVSRLKSLKKNP